MNESIWFFEEVNLFEHFCPIKNSADTYDKYIKRSYKKGEHIYLTNEDSDRVFFIHEGAVKIMGYSDDGKEIVRALLHEGEIFGELAVFGEDQRRDFAVAAESTEICILDRDQVSDLMTDVSGFRKFMMNLMGKRMVYSQQRMEALLFKDARTRIVNFILEQANKHGRRRGGVAYVKNHLTHQEIASYTGTSRQTVTTVLNELRSEKLIDFSRKEFSIPDLDALK
ncbi:MAG: Crp/Fnr family transcriptional regulator [Bacteroidia bacterium]